MSDVERNESLLLAVVVPTFNRPELLEGALASLLGQTYQNWRAYVVNDCSSVDYSSVECRFRGDSRFHFLRTEANGGINHARNVGIDQALGDGADFVTFLDDDDEFSSSYFSSALKEIREHYPEYKWFMSNNYGEQKKSSKVIKDSGEFDFIDDYIYKKFRGDKAHLFSRELFNGLRLDDKFRNSHRWPFFIEAASRGKIWAFPHDSIKKRYLDGGITKGTGKKKVRDAAQIRHQVYKHWSVIKKRPFKWIAYRYLLQELIKAPGRYLKRFLSRN